MQVELVIDKKKVTADDSQTIMEVAKTLGIEIPTLCYIKDVNRSVSCRMCWVEIEGVDNLVLSCARKVENGMVVKTNSLKVLEARKQSLEEILKTHNKNCLNCSKNLKCELQELVEIYHCNTEENACFTNKPPIDDSNHAIVRDDSKCILCGRCASVCGTIQGVNAFSRIDRVNKVKEGTAKDKPLQESTCVACGQCVLFCPTGALTQKNDLGEVLKILEEKDTITIAQVAPSVRVSIAEEFGGEVGTFAEGKLVSSLRAVGFDFVFDINMGADFTVVEEAAELIEKLESKKDLPLFTSCCPAWFNYCEKFYPEFVSHLSTTKSPNEILGSLVKYYYETLGKKVKIVSVMPCTAKKREIIAHGIIDKSITTRELGELIRLKGIDFNSLDEGKFDEPFGEYSGGGLIFGVTGGVTEATLRYAIHKLTGKKQEIIDDVRYSEGVKEVVTHLGDREIKLAIIHGLGNVPKVLDAIKSGEKTYDFIEVMACPGGCVNGGGQSYVNYDKIDLKDVIKKRSEAVYKADGNMKFKDSSENQSLNDFYKNILHDDKALIHKLMHYVHTKK